VEVNRLLKKSGFVFKKRYGQNFITDANLLRAIVSDAEVCGADTVVEVGAGAGALTKELAARAKKVVAFEIDTTLKPVLDSALSGLNNVQIFYRDLLKVSPGELAAIVGGPYKVVANLPYYITTPVIFYFLDDPHCRSMVLTVQREVAERITAAAGAPEYGAMTAQLNVKSDVTVTRHISRRMFTPRPNVDSAVARIDVRPKFDTAAFGPTLKKLIAAGFAMRRKTLVNNIVVAFALDRPTAEQALTAAKIDPLARGEVLTAADYVRLASVLASAEFKN
jgi:16S rRNA (adenine1518-N6/adenine1519-N6)-dimethyltransferase